MVQEYHPLPEENFATGLVGIFLYVLVLFFACISMRLGFKIVSTKRFFLSIILMSLFELPRYFSLAITREYESKIGYCFHIIAGVFFFIAFSIVCLQWSDLILLGSSYFRVVYGYHGLLFANIFFIIVDIIAIVLCLRSHTLNVFFDSVAFEILTLLEALRNVVYSILLAYYGMKLVNRFWHFSQLEKKQNVFDNSTSSWRKCFSYFDCTYQKHQVFSKAVIRLTNVLIISTLCFLFRVSMLIDKMAALHFSELSFSSKTFSVFGILWFTCADFIPRVLPSLAFIFLMKTRKPSSRISSEPDHSKMVLLQDTTEDSDNESTGDLEQSLTESLYLDHIDIVFRQQHMGQQSISSHPYDHELESSILFSSNHDTELLNPTTSIYSADNPISPRNAYEPPDHSIL